MTKLIIEIPDKVAEEVVKFLKDKDVTMQQPAKSPDELTAEDYRNAFKERSKLTRDVLHKYL